MALYGFSIAPVAYMSAMRETAVVFAAIMGWWFLREGFGNAPVHALVDENVVRALLHENRERKVGKDRYNS